MSKGEWHRAARLCVTESSDTANRQQGYLAEETVETVNYQQRTIQEKVGICGKELKRRL